MKYPSTSWASFISLFSKGEWLVSTFTGFMGDTPLVNSRPIKLAVVTFQHSQPVSSCHMMCVCVCFTDCHSPIATLTCSSFLFCAQDQWRTQDFRMGGVEVLQAPRGWGIGRYIPSPLRGGSGEGAVPRKIFVFFVENTTFWRILIRLFLKPYTNGRGSNPPNPLLGTPLLKTN